jgi:hypothetical protein
MRRKIVRHYCPCCRKTYFQKGFKGHLEAKHPTVFIEIESKINEEHTAQQIEKIYSQEFQVFVNKGYMDSSIGKYKFKDKKHKDRYVNKIRKYCAQIEARRTAERQRVLQSEFYSARKELVIEIVCDYFRITRKELLSGELIEKPSVPRTPGWEKLQRRGFEDGAHVPGSNVRKVDK